MKTSDLVRGLQVASAAAGNNTPNVLIDVTGDEVRFVGTNGHWLVEWSQHMELPDEAQVGVQGDSLTTLLPALMRAAERTQRGAKDARIDLILSEKAASFPEDGPRPIRIEHDLGAVTINGVSLSEVPFVSQYAKILRPGKYPPPTAWFAGAAEYILQLGELFTDACRTGKTPTLMFRTGGESDPIHVTSDSVPELTAVVMPVRCDGRTPSKR